MATSADYLIIILFLAVVCIVLSWIAGNANGRVKELERELEYEREESKNSGWEDEAKFWRNVGFPEAETKRIRED